MAAMQRKCTDESCVLHGLEHEGRPCKRAVWALPESGLDALLEGISPDRASRARAYIAVHQDAARWQKLVALARANSIRAGLGGGLMVCSAEANEHDAAWASIQALDHENPTKTLWMSEGASLADAIDGVSQSYIDGEGR